MLAHFQHTSLPDFAKEMFRVSHCEWQNIWLQWPIKRSRENVKLADNVIYRQQLYDLINLFCCFCSKSTASRPEILVTAHMHCSQNVLSCIFFFLIKKWKTNLIPDIQVWLNRSQGNSIACHKNKFDPEFSFHFIKRNSVLKLAYSGNHMVTWINLFPLVLWRHFWLWTVAICGQ